LRRRNRADSARYARFAVRLRSALVNTFHELGGAVGVAVLSSAAGAGLVMAHLRSHDFARAFTVGAVGAAVCLAIAAVLVPAVLRKPAGSSERRGCRGEERTR
jgi:hypothetical protein